MKKTQTKYALGFAVKGFILKPFRQGFKTQGKVNNLSQRVGLGYDVDMYNTPLLFYNE